MKRGVSPDTSDTCDAKDNEHHQHGNDGVGSDACGDQGGTERKTQGLVTEHDDNSPRINIDRASRS